MGDFSPGGGEEIDLPIIFVADSEYVRGRRYRGPCKTNHELHPSKDGPKFNPVRCAAATRVFLGARGSGATASPPATGRPPTAAARSTPARWRRSPAAASFPTVSRGPAGAGQTTPKAPIQVRSRRARALGAGRGGAAAFVPTSTMTSSTTCCSGSIGRGTRRASPPVVRTPQTRPGRSATSRAQGGFRSTFRASSGPFGPTRRSASSTAKRTSPRSTGPAGVGTCNPFGAGKWRDEHSKDLGGADAVIVHDDDDEGRRHARRLYESVESRAKSVRVAKPKVGKYSHDHVEAGCAASTTSRTSTPTRSRPRAALFAVRRPEGIDPRSSRSATSSPAPQRGSTASSRTGCWWATPP
jgi:hypothetical protein